ncbi:MAG: HAD family hydrolase [Verrucomicrobiota bacterium]|nr:HAD family hydrolase [Verrucomicrobiota bacterium]
MLQAVIFDMDGTLVDSNELHVDAWDEAFRHWGKEFPRERLRKQIGKGGDNYLPEFLTGTEMQTIAPEIEKFRGQLFKDKYLERVRPFPKVRDLLQRIRDDGKRVVLASSGNESEVEHYIQLAKIGELTEAFTTKTDVSHSKPSPDVFQRALKLLHLQSSDAIVVGDTPYDVQAAKKLDLPTIGLLCGGFSEDELRASGAVAIFRDPADLLDGYARSPLCR